LLHTIGIKCQQHIIMYSLFYYSHFYYFFFFNDTATTEIYTLSLHDALPISGCRRAGQEAAAGHSRRLSRQSVYQDDAAHGRDPSSEEHTSELQSRENLVCRLLLEKKKKKRNKKFIKLTNTESEISKHRSRCE